MGDFFIYLTIGDKYLYPSAQQKLEYMAKKPSCSGKGGKKCSNWSQKNGGTCSAKGALCVSNAKSLN